MQPLAKGGRAGFQGGGRTRLLEELGRVEAEPSNRNRRAEISRVHGELNRGYAKGKRVGKGLGPKGGPKKPVQPLPPDYWKDRLKDLGRRYRRPKENLIEKLGGSEKAKPHSTKEGRVASGERRIRRMLKPKHVKPTPRPQYTPKPRAPIDPRSPYVKDRVMTPLRAKKAPGGIAKIIGKKAVDWIKKNRKTIRKEIYSPEGKKKTKDMLDNLKKKYPDSQMLGPKKAKGGRIRKGHGGSAAQQHYLQHGYGPTKTKLRSGKPKIAIKGW